MYEYDNSRLEAPDICRENHESLREEEREWNDDRMTVAEQKEVAQEMLEEEKNISLSTEFEGIEEARNNVAIDHANDMRI